MRVIKHTDPCVHDTVPNFLSSEQVNKLFRLCEDFKWTDNMWFLNGDIQNQMPVRINMPGDLHDAVQEKLDYILEYLKINKILEEQDANNLGLKIIWVNDYIEIPSLLDKINQEN